ncbi:MAG TPA: glycosyltransferase family 4 protein [Euryarchaeota archaeon]|nr:D-inositol 3-phosphate glycosyltransferase [archaeon BMS3Bbin15]HDL14893.1 glycosyltransferase family 4 protein [Euryarchaeota archaeon]
MRVLLLSIWKPSRGGVVTHVEKIIENSKNDFTVIGYPEALNLPVFRAFGYIIYGFFRAVILSGRKKFDVVHAHYAFPQGFLGFLLSRVLGIPLVLTLHGSDINVLGRSRLGKPLVSFVLRHSDYICAVSEHLKREAVKLGADENKVEVVYGAPGTESLKDRKPEKGEILFVGSSVRQKGLDVLLDAFKIVRKRIPWAKLSVVGGGMKEEVASGVSFLGFREKLDEFYSRAEVVVIPSREEGLSLVALEAMALGIPVVASRVGGLPEILEGRAILVEKENPSALAEAIIKLLDDEKFREKLSKKEVRFTGRRLGENMDRIYTRAKDGSLEFFL